MQEVKEGAWIGVRGPYGTAWPLEKARGKDVLLVAGGIGLAPLRPVMYALLHEREAYGKIILVLGARQPKDILFLQELHAWGARLDITVEATVDLGLDGWKGHVGLITKLLPRLPYEPSQTVAMICGPERMMRFSAEILLEQGISADAIAVSMERNMKCAVGWCGHCQLAGHLVCKDGPVYPYPLMRRWLIEEEM
jgi:NAD(P)H-flavin reductase